MLNESPDDQMHRSGVRFERVMDVTQDSVVHEEVEMKLMARGVPSVKVGLVQVSKTNPGIGHPGLEIDAQTMP